MFKLLKPKDFETEMSQNYIKSLLDEYIDYYGKATNRLTKGDE